MSYGKYVHFHSSCEEFCGTNEIKRRFTFNGFDVTCPECMKNVTYQLSPEAAEYVRSLSTPRRNQ